MATQLQQRTLYLDPDYIVGPTVFPVCRILPVQLSSPAWLCLLAAQFNFLANKLARAQNVSMYLLKQFCPKEALQQLQPSVDECAACFPFQQLCLGMTWTRSFNCAGAHISRFLYQSSSCHDQEFVKYKATIRL